MEPQRVHIVGPGGAGTTTLGRALADEWSVPHADTDDYYWEPTDPPYMTKRDRSSRLKLMEQVFLPRSAWVLSGSLVGWGDALIPNFNAVIFLTAPPALRLDRLRRRERRRYGVRIEQGGDRTEAMSEFLSWAAKYDDLAFEGRSLIRHEHWLSGLGCPVLRLDGSESVRKLVSTVIAWTPPAAP